MSANGGNGEGNGRDFARLAYRLLVEERQAPVRDVAAAMGLSYGALYARLRGRVPFRPEEVRTMVTMVPDPRLVEHLLAGTPFACIPRVPAAVLAADDGVREALAESLRDALEVLDDIRDGSVADAEGIGRRLLEAERALAHLRRTLPRRLAESRADAPDRRQA